MDHMEMVYHPKDPLKELSWVESGKTLLEDREIIETFSGIDRPEWIWLSEAEFVSKTIYST